MKPLGPIVRLQIQRDRLKQGERPRRWYDPAALLSVPRLHLGPRGAVAEVDGFSALDVHHMDHPRSRFNLETENTLTLGFTGHYAAMRDRFGPRLTDGIAGENVIVDVDRTVGLDELAGGVLVRGQDGRELRFHRLNVAHPCAEFSHYALDLPPTTADAAVLKETLQFLDAGRRGFHMTFADGPRWIDVGDEVFAL
ncbi:MAG TPA: hypothetical protein VJ483_08790 [Holophagaceae bacterium]|nr:hypothetical protein [Holophagaceae bacterium]